MSLSAASFVVWALTVVKIFGGALLLWQLGAPAWAVAAWLLANLRFTLRLPAMRERR